MMVKITIREAKKSDTDKIANLIINVIIELFGREPINRDDYSDFRGFYKKRNGVFYVAEADDNIVGSIGILKDTDGTAKLRRMYVNAKYRKLGIGRKLFEKAINFCKEKHYKRIILCTYPQMHVAVEFYKKNGFKEYRRENEELHFERYLE